MISLINNYEIKNNTLYLYLDYSFEFSTELGIFKKIDEYIKNMKIKFKGTKIILVVGGIMLATIFYNPKTEVFNNKYVTSMMLPGYSIVKSSNEINIDKQEIEELKKVEKEVKKIEENVNEVKENINSNKETVKEEIKQESNELIVTVNRKNGEVITLSMTDYLIGVVGSEMPASFHSEALKAGVVAARTYALKKIKSGEVLTDTVSTQVYSDNNELRSKWGNEFDKYYNKIKDCVTSTNNEVITYNGELISALYFSTSNGYTESAKEVFGYDIPYLQSVESGVDKDTTPYLRSIDKETSEILNILGVINLDNIEILSRTDSGRVKEVKIDDKVYSGVELRNLLGLRSTDFEFQVNGDTTTIITKGYGHGVGMSQYGANKLANLGYSYRDIINHYYTNVAIESVK